MRCECRAISPAQPSDRLGKWKRQAAVSVEIPVGLKTEVGLKVSEESRPLDPSSFQCTLFLKNWNSMKVYVQNRKMAATHVPSGSQNTGTKYKHCRQIWGSFIGETKKRYRCSNTDMWDPAPDLSTRPDHPPHSETFQSGSSFRYTEYKVSSFGASLIRISGIQLSITRLLRKASQQRPN